MSQELVTLARFSVPMEADLLRFALEANDVQTVIVGDQAATTLGSVAGLPASVRVLVPDDQVGRARKVLRALEQQRLDERWEDVAEDHPDLWLCALCGEPSVSDLDRCPYCKTARPSPDSSSPEQAD